jgi:general secretion pathway protein K
LFAQLGLPRQQLDALVTQVTRAQRAGTEALAANQALDATMDGPLWPQEPEQLAWLGLDAATLARLQPYLAVLPERTPVNLNTASATVLAACLDGLTPSDAERLLQARRLRPWENLEDVKTAARLPRLTLDPQQLSLSTRFFALRGALQIEGRMVQEYSVVQRDGTGVKTLWRKRPLPVAGLVQAATPTPTMPTDF